MTMNPRAARPEENEVEKLLCFISPKYLRQLVKIVAPSVICAVQRKVAEDS